MDDEPSVHIVWVALDRESRPLDPNALGDVDEVLPEAAAAERVSELAATTRTCLVAVGEAGLDWFERCAEEASWLPPSLLVVDDVGTAATAARNDLVDDVVWTDAVREPGRLRVRASGVVADAAERWDRNPAIPDFKPLVEHTQDLLAVIGPDGTIRYANPAVEDILGYDREEFVGTNAFEYVHPDDRVDVRAQTESLLDETGAVRTSVYRARHADGSWRWLESVSRSEDLTAPVDGYVVSSRDVTEREQRAEQLRRAERRFQAVFDDPMAFIGILDTEGRLREVNERAREFADLTVDEVLGEPFWELRWWSHSETERQRVRDAIDRAAAGEVVRFKTTNVGGDDQLVHLDVSLRPVTHEDGTIDAIVVEGIDIDEEVKATRERELLLDAIQSAARSPDLESALTETLRTVVAGTNTVYGEAWVPDGSELELSGAWWTDDRALRSFGRESEAFRFARGEGLPGRIWESGEPEWVVDIGATDDSQLPRTDEFLEYGLKSALAVPVLGTEGEVLTVLVFLSVESHGRDERFLELLRTITAHLGAILQRKLVEDQLAAERERQQRLLETSPVGILVVGSDGRLEQENQRARDILGVPEGSTVGEAYREQPWHVSPTDGDAPELEDGWFQEVAETGTAIRNEVYVVDRSDGDRLWLLVNAAPVDGEDGPEVIVSFSDITEQKRHEKAFQNQAERVSVLNRVLRHDLRSHLTVVGGLLDRITEQSDVPEEDVTAIRRSLDELEALSHRARRIETAFESDRQATFDLDALVDRAVAEAAETYPGSRFTVETEPVPAVLAHEHLRLALDNLLENAVVHNDGPSPSVDVRVERHDERRARLVVADDGPGIPESEILLRESGLETALEHSDGLGLWIVRWLVSKSDGELRLERTEEGSRAVVVLPVAPDSESIEGPSDT